MSLCSLHLLIYLPLDSQPTSSYISTMTPKTRNKLPASHSRRVNVAKKKTDGRILVLPVELQRTICDDLSKKDLARLRLVSKNFQQVASSFLFRSVWFSTDGRDWYIISRISKHPVLRQYVREICYDNTVYESELYSRKTQIDALTAGRTSSYSKAAVIRGYELYKKYFDRQMNLQRLHGNQILEYASSFLASDPLASDLAEATETRNASKLAAHLSQDLVCLTQAFMSMPNIDTFSLSNSRWYEGDHRWARAQLSRTTTKERSFSIEPGWKPGWDKVVFDPVPAQATVAGLGGLQRGFDILIQATFISQPKNLRFFNLGPAMRHGYGTHLGYHDIDMTSNQMQMAQHAFCGLTDLDLRFTGHGPGNSRLSSEELTPFQAGKVGKVLHLATGLEKLALEFGNLSRIDDLSWILGQGAWPSLRRLTLRFMDVYAGQLASFLLLHSSSLRYLSLEDFVLREEDPANLTTGPFSHGPESWSHFFQAITALDLGELSLARLGKKSSDSERSIWHSKDRAEVQEFLHSGGSVLPATAGMDVVEVEDGE